MSDRASWFAARRHAGAATVAIDPVRAEFWCAACDGPVGCWALWPDRLDDAIAEHVRGHDRLTAIVDALGPIERGSLFTVDGDARMLERLVGEMRRACGHDEFVVVHGFGIAKVAGVDVEELTSSLVSGSEVETRDTSSVEAAQLLAIVEALAQLPEWRWHGDKPECPACGGRGHHADGCAWVAAQRFVSTPR